MKDQSETPQWAMNVVHTCMGLQRGEKILVVVDEPLSRARDALLAARNAQATGRRLALRQQNLLLRARIEELEAELHAATDTNGSPDFSDYSPDLDKPGAYLA